MEDALFDNNFFDLITCLSTVEHIGYDNTQYRVDAKPVYTEPSIAPLLDTLRLIMKWLKPGGSVMISVPYGRRSVCRHRVTKKTAFQLFDGTSLQQASEWIKRLDGTLSYKVYRGSKNGWTLLERPESCDVLYAHGFPAAAAVAILVGRKNEPGRPMRGNEIGKESVKK
jgi:hypothetical protein